MPDVTSPTPQTATRFPGIPFNSTRASAARAWHALTTERDTFGADRDVTAALTASYPALPTLALTHRVHHEAMVKHLVSAHGILNFAELGTGLPPHRSIPGPEVLTKTTQRIANDAVTGRGMARVVHVDHEQSAIALVAATTDPRDGGYVQADIRDTAPILEACAEHLGDAPRAYVMAAVAELLDDESLTEVVTALVNDSPQGSVIAIVHTDRMPETLTLAERWSASLPGTSFRPRDPGQLATLLRNGGAVPRRHFAPEQVTMPDGSKPGPVYGMLATI